MEEKSLEKLPRKERHPFVPKLSKVHILYYSGYVRIKFTILNTQSIDFWHGISCPEEHAKFNPDWHSAQVF